MGPCLLVTNASSSNPEKVVAENFMPRANCGKAHRRRALGDPGQDLRSIAYGIGFSDITHFNRAFKRRFGETPSAPRGR